MRVFNPAKRKEHLRKYREDNREMLRAARRAYYAENKDKHKAYAVANADKIREISKRCRARNPEQYNDTARRWRKKHLPEVKRVQAEWRKNNPEKAKAHQVVGNATRCGRMGERKCSVCGKTRRLRSTIVSAVVVSSTPLHVAQGGPFKCRLRK